MTGVFRAAELKAEGASPAQIRKAVASGDLLPIRRGWYASRSADAKVRDAVAVGGVLSCVSALDRSGIWVPPDSGLHVRMPLRHQHLRRSCKGYGAMPPLTSAVDPLLVAYACAARCLDSEGFVAVSDSVLHKSVYELADLRGAVSAGPRRLMNLLERCDSRSMSGTESIARIRFRRMGLKVTTQVKIDGVGYVDLLVGDRLIVECDSRGFHTSWDNYQVDRTRDQNALAAGYITLRASYEDVLFRWDHIKRVVLTLVKRRDHRRR